MKHLRSIEKIVTPIDFSDNSRLIADSAAYMAGKFGAALYLVFIVQNFEDYSGFFVPQMHVPNLEDELLTGAKERMSTFVEELRPEAEALGVKKLHSEVLLGDVDEGNVD